MNAGIDRSSPSPAVPPAVDVLSDVLGAVRLAGTMLFLVDATTPWRTWAPRAEEFRPLVLPSSQHLVSFHIVTRGGCWAGLDDEAGERFEAGDIFIVPHGDAYVMADPPDAQRSYGVEESVAFLCQMSAGALPPVVREGGGGDAQAQFICGFLGCDLRPFNPVLATLPRIVHLRAAASAGGRMHHLVQFALCEMREPSSGGRGVLLRLAELLFIEAVREYLETMPQATSGWLAGLRDPLVARALSQLHAAPARRWTLEALAATSCGSRSVLAERFAQFVGQPPMEYLARWRMQLAAMKLVQPSAKVVAVAQAVGYESEASFSRAFKRYVGISPAAWRERES